MHPILQAIHAAAPLTDEQALRYYDNQSKDCKRLGISTRDYRILCRQERVLHRWHEAECDGFIQRDEPTEIPWAYSPDPYGVPCVRSEQPLPDEEAKAIEMAIDIAHRYDLLVHVQTDPRGCALHLYREADLEGRDIDECYSTRATAVMFPR